MYVLSCGLGESHLSHYYSRFLPPSPPPYASHLSISALRAACALSPPWPVSSLLPGFVSPGEGEGEGGLSVDEWVQALLLRRHRGRAPPPPPSPLDTPVGR